MYFYITYATTIIIYEIGAKYAENENFRTLNYIKNNFLLERPTFYQNTWINKKFSIYVEMCLVNIITQFCIVNVDI